MAQIADLLIEIRKYPAAAECWRRPKEIGALGVTKAADTLRRASTNISLNMGMRRSTEF